MSNERWTYQVVEIAPSFLLSRVKGERIQEELNRLGAQGWELVSANNTSGRGIGVLQLFLKRAQ